LPHFDTTQISGFRSTLHISFLDALVTYFCHPSSIVHEYTMALKAHGAQKAPTSPFCLASVHLVVGIQRNQHPRSSIWNAAADLIPETL
jgi:hypothetical protein